MFFIMDGDDELVGTQAFSLYNTIYQRDKIYVLWSSHFEYDSKNKTQPLKLGLP